MANGTSKNVGLGKFWQDLEISEAFLISLEVSFFHGLLLLFSCLEIFSPKSFGLGFLTRISASRRVSDFTIRHPCHCLLQFFNKNKPYFVNWLLKKCDMFLACEVHARFYL